MNPRTAPTLNALVARDMRAYLQQELVRRCKLNPSYSLRAFARLLEIESSALSKILAGKRTITPKMFEKMADRLRLNPEQTLTLAPKRPRRGDARKRDDQRAQIPDYQQLALDTFQIISDWYHYAILELIAVEDFQADARWIAKVLGITPSEVNIAIERLQRTGFLTIDETGRWIDTAGAVTTVGNEFTAAAFQKLQKQILEKGIQALEETPLEKRDQSAVTLSINSALIPEAKQRIKKFRRELSAFLKTEGPHDHVYHLGISLYPVTKDRKEKQS